MVTMDAVLCMFLFCVHWTIAQSQPLYICPYKECFCDEADIQCDNRNLTTIPRRDLNAPIYMGILDFDGNLLTSISAGSLPANLSSLSLDRNPLESIDEAAFDESINTLHSLSFDGARFTQLPAAVFRLNELIELNIDYTHILVWDNDGMKKLGVTLRSLSMDTVGLTSWPVWLKFHSRLSDLGIFGSTISSLPDDALDMVADTLTGLGLLNNSFTSVPYAVSKLTALTSLSLAQNKITDLTWLPSLSNLTQLSLTDNRISNSSQLSAALRPYADTLYNFGINKNFLVSIPDVSFLRQMSALDFTNNRISDPNLGSVPADLIGLKLEYNFLPSIPRVFKSMNSVPSLDLTYNRITSLQGTDFPDSVTGIDLGHNLITELNDNSFPSHSGIQYLLLPYNPLSKISSLAFQNLPSLRELDLKYSKLTRLPLGLASLNNLISIDVSGSDELICTCMEKSLESKISSLLPDNVVGDCGQTSVYVFFKELSHDCPVL